MSHQRTNARVAAVAAEVVARLGATHTDGTDPATASMSTAVRVGRGGLDPTARPESQDPADLASRVPRDVRTGGTIRPSEAVAWLA
ncbi:hypothetical protein ACFOOM_32365 [Streptomyces echinoruber]|uniref:Uncharacterized protein n=1 Tax=Streptomyces echinoruber TaxID=68898 RepID=A0A918VPH7_9ACTN|nr:hypothetical protein [Streptomyces echinoruber]GHA13531.1 hypothetical protein GCM10010389_60460 [Streptomyces echinoruber]